MKVKNEVIDILSRAQKVKNPKRCYKAIKKLIEYLIKEVDSDWASCEIYNITIEDEPFGKLQNGDEYVSQSSGFICDCYEGIYYYPIKDSDKYLAIQYEC